MPVRYAAVAGLFYPGNPQELSSYVSNLLSQAALQAQDFLPKAKAIVVPHAGYIYSGSIVASAYAALIGTNINRVILLGSAHRLAFPGLALAAVDAFVWCACQ